MVNVVKSVIAMASVPWNAFVAAFLYYTLLAIVALSGSSPSGAIVGTAYLAPLVAYVATILLRAGSAAAHGLKQVAAPVAGLPALRLH